MAVGLHPQTATGVNDVHPFVVEGNDLQANLEVEACTRSECCTILLYGLWLKTGRLPSRIQAGVTGPSVTTVEPL